MSLFDNKLREENKRLKKEIKMLKEKIDKLENTGFNGMVNRKKKKVYQYDLNGNFIREWESTREIQRVLNLSRGSLSDCCRGVKHRHTLGGYIWKYEKKK